MRCDGKNAPNVDRSHDEVSLFRSEAREHLNARAYGDVVLVQPISQRVLTAVFVSIAVGLIIFFATFGTTRKVHCRGVLLPSAGVLRLVPGQAGQIVEARVKEGEYVQAGDIMFILEDGRSTANSGAPLRTISTLVAERRDSFHAELLRVRNQSEQRSRDIERRAADTRQEIKLLSKQLLIQKDRLALSEQGLRQFVELHSRNFLADAQVQEKRALVLDQRQRYSDLELALLSAKRRLADVEQEGRDSAISGQREISGLQRSIAALEQEFAENEARREILVRAPVDGVITAITVEPGQVVLANAGLASLIPSGSQLEAQLYVPSSAVGFIRTGMPVMLRYQAFPYQKFGQHRAYVREVASTALRPDELQGAVGSEPFYRIRLTLQRQSVSAYGKQMQLKSGMAVEASVILEERRLYEWILEPLFSISGRL